MAKIRALLLAVVGLGILGGTSGCTPFFLGAVPIPIPVNPWVTERMEEKMCRTDRTPVMPPILPGQPPVFCMDPPTDYDAIMVLPRVPRGVPFVYEVFRDEFTVVVELLVDTIDPCTFIPLLGPAQLHHCHYKCTVYFKETTQSDYPFPYRCVKERVEVVYIDKDHFHLCVGNDQKVATSITRDLSEGR